MTNRRTREFDRAVRAYRRQHPYTTLEQARAAVTARASQQATPARIPAAPLPRPAETLPGYIRRVAAATNTQRHQAMELLGLKPGTSATRRLAELTRGRLPDDAVQALVAATGMTPAQAHALAPPTHIGTAAAAAYDALRRTSREIVSSKTIRPGGQGKTRTSAGLVLEWARRQGIQLNETPLPPSDGKTVADAPALARLLALSSDTNRPLLIDTDPPRSLDWPGPALTHTFPFDLPWPAGDRPLPTDPRIVDEILKELGIGQEADADTPPNA
ncbi:hypothetical protein ABT173_22515 [Streptomyces sp. NPDC001795]|uniref:hypothetical protein n=1 Tax=Streptomyces sp. NPDC001795 TaxID=3154525 RepID=UPI00331A57D5